MVKSEKENIYRECNVVNQQPNCATTAPDATRNSDLIIDVSSGVESCDNDNSENSFNKSNLRSQYVFEQDIEKLIEVSKQFQTHYENEKVRNPTGVVVVDDPDENLNIPILTPNSCSLKRQKSTASELKPPANDVDNYYFCNCSSRKENVFSLRSSQHNKIFTPKLAKQGALGTAITRPAPKKHSCVQKNEIKLVKRSDGWNVRPYTVRYYNFNRTHPDLMLVENGSSIFPKRISKNTTRVSARHGSSTRKPLLNNGLTWHEFFERSNVYSAKSLQSSYGDMPTHTTSTQTAISESSTPKLNEISKIQTHILPQLNIRAECCVQRIPEISIAPNRLMRTVKSNIKLVEIVYEESNSRCRSMEEPVEQRINSPDSKEEEHKIIEDQQFYNGPEFTPPEHLESMKVIENTMFTDSKISSATSSKTSSGNTHYDSSLEESVSLNVSRVSTLTSAFTDHEAIKRPVDDTKVQTEKLKRFSKHRKGTINQRTILSSNDYSEFDYDEKHLPKPHRVFHEPKLSSFPTDELIQMVDEIFDTSSETVNMSHKYLVKETSVQTDIVWENINDLFKQQSTSIKEPTAVASDIQIPESFVSKPQTTDTLPSKLVNASERMNDRLSLPKTQQDTKYLVADPFNTNESYCRHTHLKEFKICSCLSCKTNIRFSAANINRFDHRVSSNGSSSSSAAFEYTKPIPRAKIKLFPSERYQRMKQAQREHFENDPRISKTLKKIYEAAKTTNNGRKETTSSGRQYQYDDPLCFSKLSSCDDEILRPDLYTLSDEILLFGLCSPDDVQYSSHLLKTESSCDTFASNDRHFTDTSNEMFLRKKLMCTDSEESFLNTRGSDLERYLLKDIENSGSDPAVLSSVFSTSSLERKINEIQLDELSSI